VSTRIGQATQSGDISGVDSPFGQLYRANVGAVSGFFARRCSDPQTVADLTSETFVRALGSYRRFDPRRGSERAWLIGISHNVFRRHVGAVPPPSPDTILHVAATETLSPRAQRAGATTISTVSEEGWLQQGKPWRRHVIAHVPGGPLVEEDGSLRLYNRTRNTLLPGTRVPNSTPRYTLTAIGGGRYRLSAPLPNGGVSTPTTIDAATVEALRDGTEAVSWSVAWDGHHQMIGPMVGPSARQIAQLQAQQPDPVSTTFAAQLHRLLDSGHARVTRTTTADGQPAIEISSVHPQSGPRTNYYVNPTTYQPIELDTFGYDSPKDVTRVHFTAYNMLPLAGHERLLRMTVPSTARVDHTPADYWQAAGLARIF
jgi:hypothetical protein